MCGIVGYIGQNEAYPVLIAGLKKLEYRGYDSAGVALVNGEGKLNVYKTKGGKRGRIISIVTEGDKQVKAIADSVIEVPQTLNALVPLLSVVPLQILAYYVAVDKGLNVDMPRNLAKSVTVE